MQERIAPLHAPPPGPSAPLSGEGPCHPDQPLEVGAWPAEQGQSQPGPVPPLLGDHGCRWWD
eukprot:8489116-Lingulodinium_polyedra.AAC.1